MKLRGFFHYLLLNIFYYFPKQSDLWFFSWWTIKRVKKSYILTLEEEKWAISREQNTVELWVTSFDNTQYHCGDGWCTTNIYFFWKSWLFVFYWKIYYIIRLHIAEKRCPIIKETLLAFYFCITFTFIYTLQPYSL